MIRAAAAGPVRRDALALGLALALGAAAGCGAPAALEASRGVVARWFEALAVGDADAALALYTEPVARGEGAGPVRTRLQALARRGAPQAREELAWTVHARVEDDAVGWYVTLVQRVRWKRCAFTLRFHLHRPFGGGEPRILGHERTDTDGCEGSGVPI